MKLLPFRLQIAVISTAISGLVLLGVGAASWGLLYRQKLEAVDTEIRALGTRHPGWLANKTNFDRFNTSLSFIFGEEHKGQIILLVKDAQGRTLYSSPNWPKALESGTIDCTLADDATAEVQAGTNVEAATPSGGPPWGAGRGMGWGMGRGFGPGRGGGPVVFTKIPKFFTVKTGDSAWRLGVMGNQELRLAVGLNYEEIETELNRMRSVFLVTLPVALLLVGGGGWLVAGRAVRPLKSISQMVKQVTAQGLDQRIPASKEDPEIAGLIQVLNGMMDRLEASFHQAVRFSADASHELKTPVAIMQGELENALQAAEPGSPEQQVFSNLLEEIQRLKTITRGLLLLSQADAGRLKLALEEIHLSADLEAMIEDASILATNSNLHFDLSIQRGLWVQADRGLLHMALLNLIHNAIKYNESGGCIGVTLALDGHQAVLTVWNTGPGIPTADQAKVFDRFYRVKQPQSQTVDGLGLGLSLAREIVQAHHGKLMLKESRPGHTCFTLILRMISKSTERSALPVPHSERTLETAAAASAPPGEL